MSVTTYPFDLRKHQRFIRFLTVGVGGTALDVTILSLLKFIGVATLPANTLSYFAGTVLSFICNRKWTFSEANEEHWNRQFVQFLMVSLVGLLLNNLFVLLFEIPFNAWLGSTGYLPAKIMATGVVVFWNYFANRFWTFGRYIA
jgi:putative flippase GtrA